MTKAYRPTPKCNNAKNKDKRTLKKQCLAKKRLKTIAYGAETDVHDDVTLDRSFFSPTR